MRDEKKDGTKDLDLEKEKRLIYETKVRNKTRRGEQIANDNDFNEDAYTVKKRSELKVEIEALLEAEDAGALLRSL